MSRTRRTLAFAAPLAAVAALAASCGGGGGEGTAAAGESGAKRITLVAYSTPREAYGEIIPAFGKTPEGRGVEVKESYGASGEQSRAVATGLDGDVVAFSLEPDVTRLVDKGIVARDWNAGAERGMVTRSVVVFLVRKGNPKNIRTWDDLARSGVGVVNPNPFVSGGARWNVMAAYGAQRELGKSHEQAVDYLGRLFRSIVAQPKSARDALQVFAQGKGDVALSYENEAITAQQKGEEVDYVVPEQTILIENPLAVVERSKNRAAAEAFVSYLRSAPAQKIFAERGYRPLDEAAAKAAGFPEPAGLFTIQDLGGWPEVMRRFFDKDAGIVADLNRQVGAPTDG